MRTVKIQSLLIQQIILPIVFIFSLTGLLFAYQQTKILESQLQNNISSIVTAVTPDIIEIQLLQGQREASDLAHRLKSFEQILQFSAYSNNHERIYLYEIPNYNQLNAPAVDMPLSDTLEHGENYIRIKTPIFSNKQPSGFVVVVYNANAFQEQNYLALLQFLGVLLLSILIATGIYTWLQRSIITPLNVLNEKYAVVIKNKDFTVQTPVSNMVEIAHLQNGFNQFMNANHDYKEELVKSENKLLQSENQLESLLNNLQDGFLLLSPSGDILRTNSALHKILDFTKPPLDISDLRLALHSYSNIHIIDDLLKELEVPKTIHNTEQNKLLDCIAISVFNSDNFIVLIRDISSEAIAQKTQQTLQQSQKMEALGNLASSIARDFNDLLTIMMTLSFELTQDLKDETHLNNAKEIYRSAELAAELTQKLLVFGRKQVSSVQLIDLNAVILRIEPIISRLIPDNIILNIRPSKLPCWLEGGLRPLEEIIINLVMNAKDAMPNGGQLTLSVSTENLTEDDPRYTSSYNIVGILTIRDTGIGIDADILTRIFEPFFTTKLNHHAIGLGLTTVKQILDNIGGRIYVESTVGEGSTFSILLPLMDSKSAEVYTEEEIAIEDLLDTNKLEVKTILVVEDTAPVLHVVVSALKRAGYETLIAHDPMEALMLLERNTKKIDLLLTDVRMPQLSGPLLFEEIKKVHATSFPVLYMSGDVDQTGSTEGIPSELLIFKPFRADEIVSKVESVIAAS